MKRQKSKGGLNTNIKYLEAFAFSEDFNLYENSGSDHELFFLRIWFPDYSSLLSRFCFFVALLLRWLLGNDVDNYYYTLNVLNFLQRI